MRATALAGPALYGPAALPWRRWRPQPWWPPCWCAATLEPAPASTAAPGWGVAVKVTTIVWPGLMAPEIGPGQGLPTPEVPSVGVGTGVCAAPATSTLEVAV